MEDRDEYQMHRQPVRDWQHVLGERDGRRALRQEILREVPARAGMWDYAMIAAGSVACYLARVGHLPNPFG